MIKKTTICVLLFLWYSALYGQNTGSKVNTQDSINQEQTAQEKPKKLYPEFNLLIGAGAMISQPNRYAVSGGIPTDRVNEFIPPYQRWDYTGLQIFIDGYWFFLKNWGLSLSLDNNRTILSLFDSNNYEESYSMLNNYTLFAGLQFRYLLGNQVILSKPLTEEERLKNSYQYCCSIFTEFKVGLNYLYYQPEYSNVLKTLHGKNFSVINPEDMALGLAYKFRIGATFYFPRILLEYSLGFSRYEASAKGIFSGVSGFDSAGSIGFYY